ncbi:MAG: rhodanese-like domain-containing protein [Bacteriovoracaceae bacterium]|nr:rhodanese-like domain-containing protein [Bacteriovoracaceae bacterium]
MDLKSFQMLEFINSRLNNIEKNIARIDEKLDFSITLQRNHLVRVKNGEEIDDSMILMGRPYNDISPQKAWSIYNNPNLDFFVIDVSAKNYKGPRLAEAIQIPIEELHVRFTEIPSKTTPLLIISENGLRSIQACELLVKKGFFNINNISGGHEFWPGKDTTPSSNTDMDI